MEVTFVTDVKFSKFKSKGKLDKTYIMLSTVFVQMKKSLPSVVSVLYL